MWLKFDARFPINQIIIYILQTQLGCLGLPKVSKLGINAKDDYANITPNITLLSNHTQIHPKVGIQTDP